MKRLTTLLLSGLTLVALSAVTATVLILMALVFRRSRAPYVPPYEEPVHVIVDADGSTRVEPTDETRLRPT